MSTPRRDGLDDHGKIKKGPGTDRVVDSGLGRDGSSVRGPGKDSTGPESDITKPKR